MTARPTVPLLVFPCQLPDGTTVHGITLRDWFAGQALSGILAKYGNVIFQ